jgi:hypothetical protein
VSAAGSVVRTARAVQGLPGGPAGRAGMLPITIGQAASRHEREVL